jgi:ABC-2 type transport system permease protein
MKSSKKARLRLSGYAALFTLLVLLGAVVVNLLVDAADQRWSLNLDLTESGLTTLSDESVHAVSALDQDAVIYLLFRTGTNSEAQSTLTALADRYHALNPRVSVRLLDPVAQPGLVNKLKGSEETLSEGSVIVSNGDFSRIKAIPSSDLYTYIYDDSTSSYQVSSFDGEAVLTSALLYVTSADAPRVLFLTGHNELSEDLCTTFTAQLARENFEVRSFELGGTEKLQAGDTLMILAPSLDMTASELSELEAFLANSGRILFVNDPSIDLTKTPNFVKFLSEAGLGFKSGVVVEDQSATGNYLSGQLYLVPNADTTHEITAPITGTRLILPGACALATQSSDKYTVSPLLTTTSKAFIKPADFGGSMTEPQDNDERGPFTLAAASQAEGVGSEGARVVAVGNLYVVADSDYMYSSSNLDFSVNAVKWLSGHQTGIQIRSKALNADVLQIPNARTLWMLAMLVVVLIPGAVLVAGTVMFLRRRRL